MDAFAKEGIMRAARSLRNVVANGKNIEAREDLAIASVLSGLCLANSKLGAVHGFAAVLGGMYEYAPHGAICAALMPHVFRKNVEKLSILAIENTNDEIYNVRLERFSDVAKIVTGNSNATAIQGALWLESLVRDLNVPSISVLCEGFKTEHIQEIIEGTAVASSTKGNPVTLSFEELKEILIKAI